MNNTDYIIFYRGNMLDIFSPNGLPVRTKTGISIKDIIAFRKNSYMIFKTKDEADDYINYMTHEVKNEAKRYDEIIPGASINIMKVINKCKSISIKSSQRTK